MKLVCNVSVGNRLLLGLPVNQRQRSLKSTLALCKHPKTEEYILILFNSQHKTGTKYKIKGNISQILSRFISEGKATIQFKDPQHDLYIQSDVIQLKSFLHLVKKVLENKINPKDITASSMSVTAVAPKDIAPRKLVIKSRSEYPIRGFPRTLEVLHIIGIKRCSLDQGILRLVKLKVLDLSENCIEFIPDELNMLALNDLNLHFNHMYKSTPKQWGWMGGQLSYTLISLNLSFNQLKYLPDQLSKLCQLVTLNISNNELRELPPGLGKLRCLMKVDASSNKLSVLPGSISKCRFKEFDLFNNPFSPLGQNDAEISPLKNLPVFSLKECSGRVVLDQKIGYSPLSIPRTLVSYLDHAKYCPCGKSCLETFIRAYQILSLAEIAQSYVLDSRESRYFPTDCYFCSTKCYKRLHSRRNRNPVM